MSDFERKYYEVDAFWDSGALTDLANRTRIEYTASTVPSDCETLVDIGCGNGIFLKHLAETRPKLRLLGFDRSVSALKHVDCEKLEGDITQIPLEDKSYDCVVCSQVLEHVATPNYVKALSELARVSAKYLVISVPYNENLESAFTQCPLCKTSFNRDLHLRTYTADTMQGLVSDFGFEHKHSHNLVKSRHYVGIEILNRLRRSRRDSEFESPICPICGFENLDYGKSSASSTTLAGMPRRTLIRSLLKRFWPTKAVDGYWIVSLYSRLPC